MMNLNFTTQPLFLRSALWPVLLLGMMLILGVTAGCGNNSPSAQIAPTPAPTLPPTATDNLTPTLPPTATDNPTPTPRPTATDNPTTPTPNPTDTPTTVPSCSWQWANQHRPEQSEMVRNALLEAGIPVTDVSVSAYGENYVCDGKVEGFTAMDTNMLLSIVYDTETTLADLGDKAAMLLTVLIEAQLLNGLREVSLSIGSKSENIWVRFKPGSKEFRDLYDQKVTGVELLEALGYTTGP